VKQHFYRNVSFVTLSILLAFIGRVRSGECDNWRSAHSGWIFCDDFETSTVNDYDGGWKQYMTYVDKSQNPSNVFSGNKSIQATISPGVNSSAGIYKYFPGQDNAVYARWYAKFDSNYNDQGMQHFVTLQGLDNSTPCGCPGCCANTRPLGNDRFLSGLEFTDLGGRLLRSRLYSYFFNQRNQSPGYRCCPKPLSSYAQTYEPPIPVTITKGAWHCMELMIRPNTPGKDDGAQKYWIDGVLVLDDSIASQPCGPYTSAITNECEQDDPLVDAYPDFFKNITPYSSIYPAEGFVWRTTAALKINNIWLEVFNHLASTNPGVNRVWFDNLVVSTSYIGPLAENTVLPMPGKTQHPDFRLNTLVMAGKIRFQIFASRSTTVKIGLYDGSGRIIARINKRANPGETVIAWKPSHPGSGIILYKAEAGGAASIIGKAAL
jgi:hypothetical protein